MSRDAVFPVRPCTVLSPSSLSPSSTVMTWTKPTTCQLTTRKTKHKSAQTSRPSAADQRCSRRLPVQSRPSIAVVWVILAASTFLFLSAMTVAASDGVSRDDAVETQAADRTSLTSVVEEHIYESPVSVSADRSSSSITSDCSQNVPAYRRHRRGHGTSLSPRERRRGTSGQKRRPPVCDSPIDAITDTRLDYAQHHAWYTTMVENCTLCVPRPVIQRIVRHGDTSFLPPNTVVYRCPTEDVCSDDDSQCVVTVSRTITREFIEIKTVINANNDTESEHKIVTKNFTEDIQCSCTPRSRVLKRCPTPFESTNGSPGRHCKCSDGKDDCKKIARGDRALNSRQLRCVNDGRCYEDICDRLDGQRLRLDKQSGYCRKKES